MDYKRNSKFSIKSLLKFLDSNRCLCTSVQGNIINNSQKVEKPQFHWHRNEQTKCGLQNIAFGLSQFLKLKSYYAADAKSLQSCQTLCDPIDGSLPGSTVPWILQARTLEWAAISFSNAWKWKVKVKSLSRVRLLATPRTTAYQAPPSMGLSRQEYWSGLPLPSPKCYYKNH